MSKVKICGLTRPEDVVAVNRALPDYAGFVFAPSRRRVDADTAARLREKLDPRVEAVGVFVNEEIGVVAEIYRKGVISLAQLHGDEDGTYIRRLKEACGCRVIKGAGVGGALPTLPDGADYALFDAISEQRGGAGRTFSWDLLRGYRGLPFFLSGGLSTENAAAAIHKLAPYCLDISSGVETQGAKDPGKIEAFVNLVRGNQT